jgi:putative membrane protein
MRMIGAVVVNALALLVAASVVPGISFHGTWITLLVAGALFGLFNLIIRPIAMFFSIPLMILTLGLFYFILNGILLWVASMFLPGYTVSGIFAGILGSLVIAVFNWLVHLVFGSDKKE